MLFRYVQALPVSLEFQLTHSRNVPIELGILINKKEFVFEE